MRITPRFLTLLGLTSFFATSTISQALDICTGDLTARTLSLSLERRLIKGCVSDTDGKIEVKVVEEAGDPRKEVTTVLPGKNQKRNDGPYVIYTNASGAVTYELKLLAKDRIREEGSMSEHYSGHVRRFERQEGAKAPRVTHSIEGLHFYAETPNHEMHWGYEGKVGPDQWGKLKRDYETCLEGKRQSPINFVVKDAKRVSPAAPIEFTYKDSHLSQVNNGHALQANVEEGSFITVGKKRYDLMQYHVHNPSEHFVDGEAFDLELHFVHQAKDKSFAVVGVMVRASEGAPDSELLQQMLSEFPLKVNEPKEFSAKVNPERLMPPKDRRAYFTYPGSLTTPPCSETVQWYVLGTPITVSQKQQRQVARLIGGKNARHISHGEPPTLPLNGRTILFSPRYSADPK